jgi:catechol 2,3-dioxygenase-like lactoylglutathione lyase family enzyme
MTRAALGRMQVDTFGAQDRGAALHISRERAMTTTESTKTAKAPKPRGVDFKLEIVVVPISDVDRAKAFYSRLGWRLDADFTSGNDWRVIQFTPPSSNASVIFGKNVTPAAPGSAQGLYLIVSDIQAARDELVARGIEVGEIFHGSGEAHTGPDEPYISGSRRLSGPDPARDSYRSFASFRDPDGNGWLLQEITTRLPGRVEADTTFNSTADLASALRRAAVAHGEHEKRTGGKHDENWPDWYADYIVKEQAGGPLPT